TYFADGPLTVADICTNVNAGTKLCQSDEYWRTILIGGLNKGGCGNYALDVTNPNEPQPLWEVSADSPNMQNLGFSYGNPVVAKNKEGKWVVMFSSGYNNIPNGCTADKGDGNGHIYVLDAESG